MHQYFPEIEEKEAPRVSRKPGRGGSFHFPKVVGPLSPQEKLHIVMKERSEEEKSIVKREYFGSSGKI